MPAARQRSSSPFMALAVTATIGVRPLPSCASPRRRGSGASARSRPCAACGCRQAPRCIAAGRPGLERLDAVVGAVGREPEQLELAHQHLAVDRMIVDHQHAEPLDFARARRPASAAASGRSKACERRIRRRGLERQRHREGRARARRALDCRRRRPSAAAAAARSKGRGRCRRSAAWSRSRPARTAGTAARAARRSSRCRCRAPPW